MPLCFFVFVFVFFSNLLSKESHDLLLGQEKGRGEEREKEVKEVGGGTGRRKGRVCHSWECTDISLWSARGLSAAAVPPKAVLDGPNHTLLTHCSFSCAGVAE